jgi:hypothetical protein
MPATRLVRASEMEAHGACNRSPHGGSTRAIDGKADRWLQDRELLIEQAECPQRDSNPCDGLERAATWTASRWGRNRRQATGT